MKIRYHSSTLSSEALTLAQDSVCAGAPGSGERVAWQNDGGTCTYVSPYPWIFVWRTGPKKPAIIEVVLPRIEEPDENRPQ